MSTNQPLLRGYYKVKVSDVWEVAFHLGGGDWYLTGSVEVMPTSLFAQIGERIELDPTGEDRIRVLRILEYEGPRSVVERTLAHNAVKKEQRFGKTVIREAILGQVFEVVGKEGKNGDEEDEG